MIAGMGTRSASVAICLAVVAAAGCGGSGDDVLDDASADGPIETTLSDTSISTSPVGTTAPATTSVVTVVPTTVLPTTEPKASVESVRVPEIVDVSVETLADQARRSSLGGADTYYWPDGNIGSVELDDGRVRFFAANSTTTARTIGTPLDPTVEVEAASVEIVGVPDEFTYAAGGPVYVDPESGALLLWYHAERHFGGDGSVFHGAIGLARSDDVGDTFTDLGIIIETNAAPDPDAPCCADVGGAPVIVRDGEFHLYFRDRIGGVAPVDIQLARASAPVDEVVAAALAGTRSAWTKHGVGSDEPGLGGRASALESGNPRTSWFDVAWHDGMQRYLMVIAVHGLLDDPSQLYLTSSADGIAWTPRQLLTTCDCELTYPSILGSSGPERVVGDELTIVYVATENTANFRWEQTSLERMTVTLSGELITGPTAWTFDGESEGTDGWVAGGDATATVDGGALVVASAGPDPYVTSPPLGLSTDEFGTVRITMSTESGGSGQVFFTTADQPGIDERRSVRFTADGTGEPVVHTLALDDVDGWDGLLDTIRIDPTDQPGTIRIDSIELLPG